MVTPLPIKLFHCSFITIILLLYIYCNVNICYVTPNRMRTTVVESGIIQCVDPVAKKVRAHRLNHFIG